MEEQARDLLTNGANAADAPRPGEILLRVKSANHPSCEDLEFYAKYSFSVKQIKETIQRLNSQHPEVKEQRLIYSGHLLDDNQILKDVLTAKNGSQFMIHNPSNPAVTMHLACTSKYIYSSSSSSSSRVGTQKPPGAEGNPMGANGVPQQANLYNNQPFPAAPNFEIPDTAVHGVPQDMLSLHQMYVEQMTAYMNQWYLYQGAMMGGMFYQMPQPPVMPNNFAVPPQAVPAPQVFPQRNDVPPVVNQPQQDNIAAARAVVDDEENQRDLLDWMYTASRVLLVFSVVYFYSSFSRFLLVIVFTALVIILQKRNAQANQNGNVPAARDAVQPGAPPERPQNRNNVDAEPNQEANANPNEENVARQRNVGAGGAENEPGRERPDGNPETPEVQPENRVSYRELMWTFVTTFFTSLIPETYQNN